jgi:predicted Zn-dependent peptidase
MLLATKGWEPGAIETDLASHAATFVSDVGYAHMSFGLTVPARSLGAGLDILSDIVTRPRFSEKDVEGIAAAASSRGGVTPRRKRSSRGAAALHPESPAARFRGRAAAGDNQ